MENPTPCSCGSHDRLIDGDANLVCASCGTVLRPATEDELAEWAEFLEDSEERDAELAADRILERQELEDFEGREFYEDCCDPYDCEYDRGGYDE